MIITIHVFLVSVHLFVVAQVSREIQILVDGAKTGFLY